MSLNTKPIKPTDNRTEKFVTAEMRNKVLINEIASKMNRLSGKIVNGLYINNSQNHQNNQQTNNFAAETSAIARNLNGKVVDSNTDENVWNDGDFTEQMAAGSIVKLGKIGSFGNILKRKYGIDGISTDYGGEEDDSARQRFSNTYFQDINENEFTCGISYSQAGETQLYAMKRWTNGEDIKLPTILIHLDSVTTQQSQIEGQSFSPLANIDLSSIKQNDIRNRASSFANAVVSAERNQILIHSTCGDHKVTQSGQKVKIVFDELCETEENNYGQYGFETRESVEVVSIRHSDASGTFSNDFVTTEIVNGRTIEKRIVVSDDVYVISYSDGNTTTFEIVGVNLNHNQISGTCAEHTEQLALTWIQKQGNEFYMSKK